MSKKRNEVKIQGKCIECAHAFVKWDGVIARDIYGLPTRNPYICLCTLSSKGERVSENTQCYTGKFKRLIGKPEIHIIKTIK